MQNKYDETYRRLISRARRKMDVDESRYGRVVDYLKWRMQGRSSTTVFTHERYFRTDGGFIGMTQRRESTPCTFAEYQAVPVKDVETREVIFK